MGIRICPKCGGKVSSLRNDCIHCGYPFQEKDNAEQKETSSIQNLKGQRVPTKTEESFGSFHTQRVEEDLKNQNYEIDKKINLKNYEVSGSSNSNGETIKRKSIIVGIIALLLVAIFLPIFIITGNNNGCFTTFNIKYHIETIEDEKTVVITGYNTSNTELVIPSEIKGVSNIIIADEAFKYCKSLEKIVISNSVTRIGKNAFEYCWQLSKVNYMGTIDQWVQIEFSNSSANPLCQAKSLYINDILVANANISATTKINKYAFYKYNSLTSVTIGGSVESIGEGAFYNCNSLTNVIISDNVTSIGENAFYNCNSLTNATISDSVESIGEWAFFSCPIEKAIVPTSKIKYVKNSKLKEVVITSGERIADYAFNDCISLTSVTIGNSVTNIGDYAFYNCASLTNVYYKDMATQWGKIEIGDYNARLTNATRYYYVERESDLPNDNGNYWHYVDGVPTIWATTEE